MSVRHVPESLCDIDRILQKKRLLSNPSPLPVILHDARNGGCFHRNFANITGIFYPLNIQLFCDHHPGFVRGPYEQTWHQKSQRFE